MMRNRGFSLGELLVVLAIVGFMTIVVLFNYRSYDSKTVVAQAAQEIELAIREAQVSTTSGRETGPGSNCFTVSYGIYVGENDSFFKYYAEKPTDGDANCVVTSAQLPPDFTHKYESATKMVDRTVPLRTGFIIEDIEIRQGTGNFTAAPGNKLSISFAAPYLGAEIRSASTNIEYDAAQIILRSPHGDRRYVIVESTGKTFVSATKITGNELNRGSGGDDGGDGEKDGEGKGGQEEGS
jgi:prepilin-type N-terminal cleavage/methylation domain-containing protein